MVEENNIETSATTFAQESATPPEKTELEKVQERIANYKVGITPQVAQFSSVLLENQLKNGLVKSADLEAYVQIRDELNTGIADYQQSLQVAQRQIAELQEQHALQKQAEIAQREQDLKTARDDERKRRKSVEDKLAQMEAVLKSHGISMDLNNDGIVGLSEGQEQRNLTPEELAEVNRLMQESSAATELVETPTADGGPTEPKKPSRAFEMARAMNPITEDKEFSEKVEETKQSFKEWDEANNESTEEVPTIELPVPEDAKGTEEFDTAVEEVAKANENVPFQPVEEGWDANGSPVAEELRVAEEDTETEPTLPQSQTSAPIITGGNAPSLRQTLSNGESVEAPVKTGQRVRMIEEDDIADLSTQEEEYEEVTIPTPSELEALTKSKIKVEANKLGFTVDLKDSKEDMISSFVTQTEEFIASLQDEGTFVSASETDEGDTSEKDDVRDGGYFG
tara:strand:+ start:3151 stop:4512 length:1362 start_codon:yes stop_codon:yes gene_type:complete